MTNTTTVGVDLAKHSFSICQMNGTGHVLQRRDLKRDQLAQWLVQLPVGTIVAMETCSGAHYWARLCLEYGLRPRLIAAHLVKPFRKSRAIKNDRNDAEAIATAAQQGHMRFVPMKTVDQQARLSWHRAREGYKADKTAMSNRMRGLLAEFGVVMAQGDKALKTVLADLAHHDLPEPFKVLLQSMATQWRTLDDALTACTQQIEAHAKPDVRCQRIGEIIGVGALTADAAVATIGSAREFKNGRHMAAWLGLVPRQHTTGGHIKLGRITRHGDTYLRTLLVQGARSSLLQAQRVKDEQATPEQQWIQSLACRMPFGKVIVAIANKHARQIWAVLAHDVDYDPYAGPQARMLAQAA
ncbi:MAG: IS110 family transposase [Salinisphaera sp.]|nr:IS110 family transposase [Salinisphaera sp.]